MRENSRKPATLSRFYLTFSLIFFVITILLPNSAVAFSIGDRVKATANLYVRSCASTTCTVITTESAGSTGTISNGPYSGSGYTWWYINWDNGYTGYSVQDYLAAIPGSFTLSLTPECSGTTSQIRLNWTSSSNATSYDVYRNGSLYSSGVTGTQFINTLVTAGTSYSYYVQAKNSNGTTNSNTLSATAPTCTSSQTLSVNFTASSSSGSAPLTANLTADIAGTATGTINYTFWWNCSNTGTSVSSVTSVCGDPWNSTYGAKYDGVTDDPKTISHTYSSAGTYTAKVIVERGSASPVEARVTITVTSDTTNPTVSSFSVTPSSLTLGSTVTISYTVSDTGGSGLKQVELWRANDSGGSPGTWGQITTNTHSGNGPVSGSFTNTPSSAGTYWYGIHAVDNAGNWTPEPTSAKVVVNPTLNVTFSASQTSGLAPLATNLSADISGTATGTINYTFWWNCSNTGTSVSSVSLVCGDPWNSTYGAKYDGVTDDPKTISHTYSSAGTYTAKVIVERGGASPVEARVAITVTSDTTPPTTPSSLTASTVSSSQINLIWTASTDSGGSGLAGYKIERCTGSGCTNFAQVAPTTSTSYSDTSLSASTTYTYRVRAYDNVGNNSGYSNTASAATQVQPDTTAPTASAFSVTPPSLTDGASVTVSYTVSDNGGSGLKQVELWRASDTNGDGQPDWPTTPLKTTQLSGNGPVSGSFTDVPPSSVVYWYGIHILDNAGNIGYEPNPPGPIKVTDYQSQQGYLNNTTTGVHALYSWGLAGGAGAGIKIVDVEGGWQTTHEDFPTPFTPVPISGTNSTNNNHGTAVVGVMVAKNNGLGVTGIAYDAQYSAIDGQNSSYDPYKPTADAIKLASDKILVGDIILIELHALGPDSWWICNPLCGCSAFEYVPMEYWIDVHDAIMYATNNGRIVVEAGGNGSMDLDSSIYDGAFTTRANSGAILVGAGTSDSREPLCFTNYGSRMDVQGWGENVVTTGYGDLFNGTQDGGVANPDRYYTSTFSGTSSASPIVAGSVAAIQGRYKAISGGSVLSPQKMRDLIKNTGTAQGTGGVWDKQIGPLPNIEAAINALPDTAPPTVSAFSVTPSSVILGNPFTISYTVSDTGGSGLNRVELWRANDSSGSPTGWAEIKRTYLSGNGPTSGSFSDAPSSAGAYWYGIHVVDNAGNWNDEQNSNTGGSPGDFGPIKLSVTAADTTPDQFTFTDQTNIALNTVVTSNQITVSGINAAASISITGGTYSVNGGAYTSASGTVSNGNTVTVRLTSSGSYSTTTSATLAIGGVSDTFSVTTMAAPADTTPDPFTFTDQTGIALNTTVTSNTITVTGINAAASISFTGGTYSINGGAYTSASGTVNNGNTVTVRVTSPGSYSTTTSATLTIGGVSDTFSVTTMAAPTDTTPPTGSISINSSAAYTNSTSVTLSVFASDSSGVSQMCISNSTSCSSWETYSTSKSWTLSSGDGTKTVYAWFKDSVGNANTSPYSDSIILDTTAPTDGALSASPGNGQISLSWSGFSDATSGIGSYKLAYSTSSVPSSCSSGTEIYSGPNTSYTHTGLINGTNYHYRICAIDNAGNSSTGKTAVAMPEASDTTPPTGSITINSGAAYTNFTSATLTLSCTDASGCSQMQFSNDNTNWSTAEAYAASKTWTLSNGDGIKMVYVKFKDGAGNWSSAYNNAITLDATVPSDGTLTATADNTTVVLSWSNFSDAGSGIASYKLVYTTGSAPASCSIGTQLYSGSGASYTHTGLSNGTTYYYRICATDNAGNSSTGAASSAIPVAPDGASIPPSDTGITGVEREDGGSDNNNIDSTTNKPRIDITYNFGIVIKDPTGSQPQYTRLYITDRSNPSTSDFYYVDLVCDSNWAYGATCNYATLLGPVANHKYYFEAKLADGSILRYPSIGEIAGPVVELLTGYNMVSIPRDTNGANMDGSTAFGNTQTYKWVSTGLTGSANSGSYVLVDSNNPVKPGEGYFTMKGDGITTLPEHGTYADTLSPTYEITLKPGWNMISNPYGGNVNLSNVTVQKGSNTPVSWTDAAASGYVVNAIYYYKGSDWGSAYTFESAGASPDAMLVPWFGYWVYLNKNDDTYYLVITRP